MQKIYLIIIESCLSISKIFAKLLANCEDKSLHQNAKDYILSHNEISATFSVFSLPDLFGD